MQLILLTRKMRIIASLPDKKHFKPLGSSERWKFIFESIYSPKLRLCSPVLDPWKEQKEWSIRVRESKGKSDKAQYTNRIDLQLFTSDEDYENTHKAKIIWEIDKGVPHSNQPTLRFYAIPFVNLKGQVVNLMLSIVDVEAAK